MEEQGTVPTALFARKETVAWLNDFLSAAQSKLPVDEVFLRLYILQFLKPLSYDCTFLKS